MNPSHRAFTLVEILVVLAVVGVLAAILFPVVSRARASARTSTCAANLRQIGQAVALYKSDHDGSYPLCTTTIDTGSGPKYSSVWWMDIGLQPPLVCPEVDFDLLKNDSVMMRRRGSYSLNLNLNEYTNPATRRIRGARESASRYPSLTVVAFDSRPLLTAMRRPDAARTKSELFWTVHAWEWEDTILQFPLGATRHQGGANYLFGDGHVKWYRPEQLSTAPKNDGVHPGFGL